MREDISLIKKTLGQGEMGKIWSINPLLAITHNTFFIQLFAPLPYQTMHFPELKFMSMHLLKETLHIIAGAFNELRGYWPNIFTKLGNL